MEPVEIKVRHNGPYKVTGPIRLIDADGNEYDLGADGEPIVLCRCGGSDDQAVLRLVAQAATASSACERAERG